MAIGSLGLNTTVTTTGAAAQDLKGGTAAQAKVFTIEVNLGAATASTYGIGRSGNTPTQTSPVLIQNEDPNGPAFTAGCAVAWSVAPTVPSQFFRRIALPGTIGSGYIVTFPRGLLLAVTGANNTLLFWNLATNANNCNVNWTVEE